ncbi:SDR family NAD(P)-dependent oxidoreductase [Planktotalea arctica]|uniref:SDR family NAD(P)-dependent oxidoreductase n=1 Tax=Planktotalea arctica TaxID=1481893 RepID=UPI000A171B5E|nr:SDR family NAD(P)-dependent oxidoreductase [Planktotalea arctica]
MSGKVAIITGAAGGMGQAFVQALLADGMKVAGFDIAKDGLEALDAAHGADFLGITVDLTDPDAVAQAFGEVEARFGGVDILVNNAGTCFMSEFPNIPADEFQQQMALNFSTAFYCCQNAVPMMLKRGGVKKIINISSNGAYNFDVFDPPPYRASKAALDTLTKDLARRYATDKICVNSIAPAMTQTPLFGVLSEEVLAKAIAQMPHGEAMQPAQIAGWVSFLAGPMGDVSSGNVFILNQGRDVR